MASLLIESGQIWPRSQKGLMLAAAAWANLNLSEPEPVDGRWRQWGSDGGWHGGAAWQQLQFNRVVNLQVAWCIIPILLYSKGFGIICNAFRITLLVKMDTDIPRGGLVLASPAARLRNVARIYYRQGRRQSPTPSRRRSMFFVEKKIVACFQEASRQLGILTQSNSTGLGEMCWCD